MPYSSCLTTQVHYCLSTRDVTPSSANTNPTTTQLSPRLLPGCVCNRPLLRLACLQLAPQLPGVMGDHGVQITSAHLPPCLEHRTPPARADAERELRERGLQPDQLRPHPRRSRLLSAQQRPAVQRQAPVIPLRLHGAASVLSAKWWRVVFPRGHGSARLQDVPG